MQTLLFSVLLALSIGNVSPVCDCCQIELNTFANSGKIQAVYYCSNCAADNVGNGAFCAECFRLVHDFE